VRFLFFKHDVFPKCVCPCVSVCVFIIQGHSIAPHGSIPYPGRHGYWGHLSQRVPADQTGVHPDDVTPPRLLLGTFVAHNAQVFVAAGGNQHFPVCVCVCVCCPCGRLLFNASEKGCSL